MDKELIDETLVEDEEVLEPEYEEEVEETDLVDTEEEEKETEEETFFTQEQVESAVKTRVNTFNRKIEKLKPYEVAVKKISDITGLPVDKLITRLEGMSDIEQAKILGVTPQQLASKRQVAQTQKTATEQTLRLQRELDEQKLLVDPKYKDYPLFKEEIDELLEDNPKLSIKQAYVLAKGETGTKAAIRDAEQRTVAKMTKSSNQKLVKPGQSTVKSTPKLDQATISAAKRVGMDPLEYAAYANMSSLDDYEKMKAKKSKK